MHLVRKHPTLAFIIVNALFLTAYFSYFRIYADSADMAENYVWGMVWNLGNNKHPPLFGWVTALWFTVLPSSNWAYFALSQFNLAVALYYLYKAIREFFIEDKCFIAIALTATTLSLGLRNGWEYNANLAQLPFLTAYTWALIRYYKSDARRYVLSAAILGAAAFLCKYSAVLLLFSITLVMWGYFKPSLKKIITDVVILSAVSAIAVMPHLIWEYQHHFPALNYMHTRHIGSQSVSCVTSSLGQLLYAINFGVISIAILCISAFKDLILFKSSAVSKERLGIKLFLLSCCLTLIGAILQSLQADLAWFIVPTMFFGWALADLIRPGAETDKIKRNLLMLLIVYYVAAGIIGYQHRRLLLSHQLPKEAIHEALVKDISELYYQKYHEKIPFVGGSFPLPYQFSFYSPDHPSSIYGLYLGDSTWINSKQFEQSAKVIVCGSLKREYPIDPDCTKMAVRQFGIPSKSKQLMYSLYDSSNNTVSNAIFNVMLYH